MRANERAFCCISRSTERSISPRSCGVTKRTSPISPSRLSLVRSRRRVAGGALGLVELGPGPEQVRDVGVARVQAGREREERIGLLPHPLRHLGELDQVVSRARVRLQSPADLAPQLRETLTPSAATRMPWPAAARCSRRGRCRARSGGATAPGITASGRMNSVSSPCRPTTIAGCVRSNGPTCRHQAASQSKLWKAVQSAVCSSSRHSCSTSSSR